MTVEVIPDETEQVDELLSQQIKNWKEHPFDPSSAVYVYERQVIPYEEVQQLFRAIENKGINPAILTEMKHYFGKFWSREMNVNELNDRVDDLVDEISKRYKISIEIPSDFEMKFCFARDLQSTLNGGEHIHGIFHDINEALAYINSKDRGDSEWVQTMSPPRRPQS